MGQPPATLSIFDDAATTAALADAGVTGGAGAAATLRAAALARILATGAACLLGSVLCVCSRAAVLTAACGYARAGEVPTLASLGGAEGPSAAAAAALAGRGFGVASSHVAEERTSSDGTLLLHAHVSRACLGRALRCGLRRERRAAC
jgi:hypothetical protein